MMDITCFPCGPTLPCCPCCPCSWPRCSSSLILLLAFRPHQTAVSSTSCFSFRNRAFCKVFFVSRTCYFTHSLSDELTSGGCRVRSVDLGVIIN